MGDMTKDFSRSEFQCTCGCGEDEIRKVFVVQLQIARNSYGAMEINSGCRCKKHNKDEGGKSTSSHLIGWAADIACVGMSRRFRLLKALLDAGFRRIGIGKDFIHVDDDPGKPGELIWLY